jgi:hypothetical protein
MSSMAATGFDYNWVDVVGEAFVEGPMAVANSTPVAEVLLRPSGELLP